MQRMNSAHRPGALKTGSCTLTPRHASPEDTPYLFTTPFDEKALPNRGGARGRLEARLPPGAGSRGGSRQHGPNRPSTDPGAAAVPVVWGASQGLGSSSASTE
jgi:hypothetical protein